MKYNSIYLQRMDKIVEDGKLGNNIGLPMGLPRFSEFLCGIGKGRYDLVGGHTGTGKTAFVDQNYVLSPLMYLADNKQDERKLVIFYNSLEISPERKLLKWATYLMLYFDGIYVDSKHLARRSAKDEVPKEHYESYEKARDYLNSNIIPHVRFNTRGDIDVQNVALAKYAAANYTKIIDGTNDDGTPNELYIHKDPTVTVQSITDHNGLSRKKGISDKKKVIDEKSQNNIKYRNDYGISCTDINQLNRSYGLDARKLGEELAIQLEDFKETGSTQEDADTVYALFNAHRYGLSNYRGLDIKSLKNLYREVSILKNREGNDGTTLNLKFLGKCGMFVELPTTANILKTDNFYDLVKDINYGRRKPTGEISLKANDTLSGGGIARI